MFMKVVVGRSSEKQEVQRGGGGVNPDAEIEKQG
jgi:hypothetical protein